MLPRRYQAIPSLADDAAWLRVSPWPVCSRVASACTRTRPPLDEANEIRLDAFVELTAHRARSVICLSVDPRSGSAAKPVRSEPFARAQDPEAELFDAVSRMGEAYPGSRCEHGDIAGDGAIRHPRGPDRAGIFVTLGAVNLSSDDQRADLLARVSTGALTGELRRFAYRRQGTTWQLSSNSLLMQE